jgi:hypothetical protein
MARFSTGDVITQALPGRATTTLVFKTGGSSSFIVPAGVNCITFELWGAGAAGGARCCCDCYHQGFPGGPGSYTAVTMPTVPGTTYTLNVGTGGGNDSAETTPISYSCLGGAGGATYISGTGITTLCAAGGISGNNDCYQYCMCASCCGAGNYGSCINVTGSASLISCIATNSVNACSSSAGGIKQNNAHIGMYSDSQGSYYPSWTTGTPWQSGRITSNNNCTTYYCSCGEMNCTNFGQGGSGAYSQTCCLCNTAGSGRNGAIIITY